MRIAQLSVAAAIAGLAACGGSPSDTAGDGTGITLPAGFTASIFADGLDRPRHLAVRDNGDVYVTLRTGAAQNPAGNGPGGVVALRDRDGDGRADVVERFGRPDTDTGLAIYDNHLFYASTLAVYAVELDSGLVPSGESELVVDGFLDSGGGHASKPITFDGEGHIYVQAGVPSNACQAQPRTPGSPGLNPCPQLERFGGVWRLNANSRGQKQAEDGIHFSTGHRNVVALEWNPTVDQLYLVMHGRDQLDQLFPEYFTAEQRAELPAEEFHAVSQGDDLGWPYTYYDPLRGERMVAPEYGGDGRTPAQAGLYKEPLVGFPAHWAPNDLVFYTGSQFPARYRNGAFIAFHGSWNRQPEAQGGYAVAFVPMADGRPSGDWEIFADDFEGPEPVLNPADAAHRPTGLAVGPDGSLYISDDVGGRIWKVSYTGT
jgi:glucose/arabinose dehydrogenase